MGPGRASQSERKYTLFEFRAVTMEKLRHHQLKVWCQTTSPSTSFCKTHTHNAFANFPAHVCRPKIFQKPSKNLRCYGQKKRERRWSEESKSKEEEGKHWKGGEGEKEGDIRATPRFFCEERKISSFLLMFFRTLKKIICEGCPKMAKWKDVRTVHL